MLPCVALVVGQVYYTRNTSGIVANEDLQYQSTVVQRHSNDFLSKGVRVLLRGR